MEPQNDGWSGRRTIHSWVGRGRRRRCLVCRACGSSVCIIERACTSRRPTRSILAAREPSSRDHCSISLAASPTTSPAASPAASPTASLAVAVQLRMVAAAAAPPRTVPRLVAHPRTRRAVVDRHRRVMSLAQPPSVVDAHRQRRWTSCRQRRELRHRPCYQAEHRWWHRPRAARQLERYCQAHGHELDQTRDADPREPVGSAAPTRADCCAAACKSPLPRSQNPVVFRGSASRARVVTRALRRRPDPRPDPARRQLERPDPGPSATKATQPTLSPGLAPDPGRLKKRGAASDSRLASRLAGEPCCERCSCLTTVLLPMLAVGGRCARRCGGAGSGGA